ncbi:MAG: hypothetical protein NC548_28890 [Lachnospiraceae bacterium]|nr:hypothetical protein [Lachnospiraceae bacterium]MCM1233733.1 hypothetical protein [Ruminococcus flavefaciens]
MINTELTNKAIKLSYQAHMGQYDWGGMPYFLHPYHVAEQMNTEKRCCIALLHDVLEDTEVTKEELEKEFPMEIVEAVRLLTHDGRDDYYDYVKNVCTNEDAAYVKLADLLHNLSEDRLSGTDISIEEKNRWLKKYLKAVEIVSESLNSGIIVSASTDDQQWGLILKHFKLPDRAVILETDQEVTDYLTGEQYETLRGKTIEEQMEFFEVIRIDKKEGAATGNYHNVSSMKLKEFMRADREKMLLLASGCIIGFLDIRRKEYRRECRKIVAPVYAGRSEVCRIRKGWIDHSWDHMAVVTESVSYQLKMK